MLKRSILGMVLLALGIFLQAVPAHWEEVASRFYKRECGNKYEHLTYWSEKEAFPSFGVAHFIWIPKDIQVPFEDLFPEVLCYMQAQGVELPIWLDPQGDCPWSTREAFYNDGKRLEELRQLLWSTRELQVSFIAERFCQILKQIEKVDPKCVHTIEELSKTQKGFYAMLDYSHFKGTGLNLKERYGGIGWGLLQVFQEMDQAHAYDLLAFVESAQKVLERRVKHSHCEKHEKRFLSGWLNRVKGYL